MIALVTLEDGTTPRDLDLLHSNTRFRWAAVASMSSLFATTLDVPAGVSLRVQISTLHRAQGAPLQKSIFVPSLAPAEMRSIEIALQPVREVHPQIRVLDRLTGLPVKDAQVACAESFTRWTPNFKEYEEVGVTESHGLFEIKARGDREYSRIRVSKAGYMDEFTFIHYDASHTDGAAPQEILISPNARLRVTVVRGAEPVPAAQVEWASREDASIGGLWLDRASGTEPAFSDPNGIALVSGIPPDARGELVIQTPNHERACIPVDSLPSGSEQAVRVDLEMFTKLQILVLGRDRSPRAGVLVGVQHSGSLSSESSSIASYYSNFVASKATSDENGLVAPLLVPAGVTFITANPPQFFSDVPNRDSRCVILEPKKINRVEILAPRERNALAIVTTPFERWLPEAQLQLSVEDAWGRSRRILCAEPSEEDLADRTLRIPFDAVDSEMYRVSACVEVSSEAPTIERMRSRWRWLSPVVKWRAGSGPVSLKLEETVYFSAMARSKPSRSYFLAAADVRQLHLNGSSISKFAFKEHCMQVIPRSLSRLLLVDSEGRTARLNELQLSEDLPENPQSVTLDPAAELLIRHGAVEHPTAYAVAFEHQRFAEGVISRGKRKRISVPAGRLEVQAWSPAVGYFERSIVTTAHETTELWISND